MRRGGAGGRLARGIQLTVQPILALHRTLSLRLASAPWQGLHVTDVGACVVKDSARYLTLPYARHAMTQILQQHYVQLASQSLMCPRVHTRPFVSTGTRASLAPRAALAARAVCVLCGSGDRWHFWCDVVRYASAKCQCTSVSFCPVCVPLTPSSSRDSFGSEVITSALAQVAPFESIA